MCLMTVELRNFNCRCLLDISQRIEEKEVMVTLFTFGIFHVCGRMYTWPTN